MRSADRLLAKQEKYARRLAETPEGRAEIESLTDHPLAGVRILSAHATYFWNEGLAVKTLTAVAKDPRLERVFRDFALAGLKVLPELAGRAE